MTVKAKDGRAWTVHHAPTPTLRLYILIALHTAARRAELLRLTWRDVDMRQRTITFRGTKNGSDRTVPMTETVREAFQELPRPLDVTAAILPPYADPHVLTRSFARLVKRLGLALIQKFDRCPQVSHSVGDDRHDDEDKDDQNHHSGAVHLPSLTSGTPPVAPVPSAA